MPLQIIASNITTNVSQSPRQNCTETHTQPYQHARHHVTCSATSVDVRGWTEISGQRISVDSLRPNYGTTGLCHLATDQSLCPATLTAGRTRLDQFLGRRRLVSACDVTGCATFWSARDQRRCRPVADKLSLRPGNSWPGRRLYPNRSCCVPWGSYPPRYIPAGCRSTGSYPDCRFSGRYPHSRPLHPNVPGRSHPGRSGLDRRDVTSPVRHIRYHFRYALVAVLREDLPRDYLHAGPHFLPDGDDLGRREQEPEFSLVPQFHEVGVCDVGDSPGPVPRSTGVRVYRRTRDVINRNTYGVK